MKMRILLGLCLIFSEIVFAQDEDSLPWSLSAAGRYMNRYTSYGVDLSNNKPALGYDVGIAHENGLSATASAIQTLGTGGTMQQWSVALGYDWQVNDWFSLSAEYTYYNYKNDSVNVLAGLSNALSFAAEISSGEIDIGFSYDTFLGGTSASYYGIDISGFSQFGDLTVVPFVQAVFMSQEVENRLLISKMGIGKGGPPSGSTSSSSVTTVTGLSNFSIHAVFIYPVLPGLSLSLHPSFQYSPKAEVSARTSQIVWSAGFRYTLSL